MKLIKKGDIRIIGTNKILKLNYHSDYPRVRLRTKDNKITKEYFIHSLLGKTFLEKDNPNLIEIDHIDRNKTNFSLSNLRWYSPSDNKKNRGSLKHHGIFYIKLNDKGEEIERIDGLSVSKNFRDSITKSIRKNIKYLGHFWKRIVLDVEEYYKQFSKEELMNEVWKKIPGLEASGWLASNLGTLKNSCGEIVVGTLNDFGYRFVNIQKKVIKFIDLLQQPMLLGENY